MAWIESHQELGHHPKLKKLCRVLNISQPAAVGHLQYLWWWAVDYCDNGDLTRFDPLDIAIAAMWEGDPDEFLDALIHCGWVDRALDVMFIHDWQEYIGRLLDRRRKDADRKRASRGRPEDVPRTSSGHPKDGAQTAHVTVPYRTVPNPTEPSRATGTSEVGARSAPKPKQKTRLAADWFPSDANLLYAQNQGMSHAEIQKQADLFRDHWQSNGEPKQDWDATWRNWVRRAPEFSAPRGRHPTPGLNRNGTVRVDFAALAKELKEQGR